MRGPGVMALVVMAGQVTAAHATTPLRDAIEQLACGDQAAATAAVDRLAQAPRGILGLPDESLTEAPVAIDGAVIDRLLEAAADARTRFPAVASEIDELVASWNYCAVTADQVVSDLRVDGDRVERSPHPQPSTIASRGFAAWRLIPRDNGGRPRSAAPTRGSCGVALVSSVPSGSLPALTTQVGDDPACVGPAIALPPSAPIAATPVVEPERVARRAAATVATADVYLDRSSLAPRAGRFGLVASIRETAIGTTAVGAQASWSPGRNLFARLGATWMVAREDGMAPDPLPGWSWVIGYDNWRPGTWSVQLAQWGPVTWSSGRAALTSEVAEVGYKLPLGPRLGSHLGIKVSVGSPLSWAPWIGASTTIKLPGYLFVATGISYRDRAGAAWTYALGRSTWKASSVAIVLANWGPNELDELGVRRCSLTASWSWGW